MSTIARRRVALAAVLAVPLIAVATALSPAGDGEDAGAGEPAAPPRPPRVALQAGHWQHERLPDELEWVRRSAGGAVWGSAVESEVNLAIARNAERLLEERGVEVDVLPATVEPRYRADAFVSIHADGNGDVAVSGFKTAPAAEDASGLARTLNDTIARRYGERTGLPWNTAITADMTDYYAFDAGRFRHAIDAATPAVVLETGFLTSPQDRAVIVDAPQIAARGVADGVAEFLARRRVVR